MLAVHGWTQLKEAETQNLLAKRQQNQAVYVGKGKNELGPKLPKWPVELQAGSTDSNQLLLINCEFV